MDFQNVNTLNFRLNLFSGNLLPMNSDSSFSLFWKIHSVFVWILVIITTILIIPACIYISTEKATIDGIATFIELMEMFFMVLRIHFRKDLVYQLIQKLKEILYTADETMKNVVTSTLGPIKSLLNFYLSSSIILLTMWHCIWFILVFNKNLFYYEDYRIPVALFKQPFSFKFFVLGSLIIQINIMYMFMKKVGVEVYTMHLVLMVTAQYRYIAIKIAMIFQDRNEDDESQKLHSSEFDRRKEKEIRALCRHHNDVIYLSSLLKELLSLNFSLMYIIHVLRFCFYGILLSDASLTLGEFILVIIFMSSAILELYLVCFCAQQFSEASTEITDKAFHENWYLLQPSIKHIFMLIIMANNLKCNIGIVKNFNFSLPSFMTILNQSYSIAVLLSKME